MVGAMTLRQLMRRLFPVLMVAGLVLSPFSASAAANAMGRAMGAEAMIAMAGDMPGCPSGQPAMPDCQKTCPLMTICAANWVAGAPVFATSILAFGVSGDAIRPGNDAFGGPLTEGPPARPPRT
jgi:hypothetical protein